MSDCYCGNSLSFENCCAPFIKGIQKPATAEALMRSRYCAYATGNADYLIETTHISTRKFHRKSDILAWSKNNQWLKLIVLNATENTVTFEAYFLDENFQAQVHYEHSAFTLENECWYYVDGEFS